MAAIPGTELGQGLEADAASEVELAPIYPTLGRLRALHAEAEETARLANLLGRSIHAALALALGGVLAVAFSGTDFARELAFAGLMLLAVGALVKAYRHTLAAPFERSALRSFAKDLDAIFLYAGFAWGSGAFLALPIAASPFGTIAFSAGMCVLLALLLRKSEPLFQFAIPVAALCAGACFVRPLPGSGLAAIAIVLGCGFAAGMIALVERRQSRAAELPGLDATVA